MKIPTLTSDPFYARVLTSRIEARRRKEAIARHIDRAATCILFGSMLAGIGYFAHYLSTQ